VTPIERSFVLLAVVFAGAAVVGWGVSVPHPATSAGAIITGARDVVVGPIESINVSARIVIASDPFRLARRPSPVAYRRDLEGVTPPPKAPKPTLVLEGLVGDAALLDGVPGHSATAIARVGDTVGGLRVRRIGRDTVIVIGPDTTWRLTVRRTWQ
jgi:hypothetical protein